MVIWNPRLNVKDLEKQPAYIAEMIAIHFQEAVLNKTEIGNKKTYKILHKKTGIKKKRIKSFFVDGHNMTVIEMAKIASAIDLNLDIKLMEFKNDSNQ